MDYKVKSGSPIEVLAHHGIKGMRWGQRKAERQDRRALDKAARQKDRADRNAAIDAARVRLSSGGLAKDYKKAKIEYKAQRKVIGHAEAKKVLRSKREKLNTEYDLAKQTKHGAETAIFVIGTVGGVVLGSTMLLHTQT